ncbi:MAG TPA: cob(I)yrinic acid a,c-diamide adenosyltransferase [Candidatus Polarisedimenticolaceae bacterium]|nr:cob(I)yrinic acid a,c-diamide adenosyltransferase [Candidatus Polarisedimenticolaceae bacterium]
MPKLTRIYTRAGDDGSTSLGGGRRTPKDGPRVSAYGTVDELNAVVGAALATGLVPRVAEELRRVQNELLHLGADLCTPEEDKVRYPVPVLEARHVEALERTMDELSAQLGPLQNFVLPGGSPGAALLHVARTVCRRAERDAVALAREEAVGDQVVPYLNRLSDALFVLARWENRERGIAEPLWDSRR